MAWRAAIFALGVVSGVAWAAAPAEEGIPHVRRSVGAAVLDWTAARLIGSADGVNTSGAMTNVQTVELNARQKLGPLFLDLTRRVPFTTSQSTGDLRASGDALAERLDVGVSAWEVREARYYTGGAVELDGALDLHPWLRPALVAGARAKHRGGPASGEVTGLVVDARGLGVDPVVAPRIVDPDGGVVYSLASMTAAAAGVRTPCAWVADPADPLAAQRGGAAPLVVRAVAAVDRGDVRLSGADAALVKSAAELDPFLMSGLVAIVVDP